MNDEYSVAAGAVLQILPPGVALNDNLPGAAKFTVTLVSGPSHGGLMLDGIGGFEYVPAKGFSGKDVFRYGISEGAAYGEADVLLRVIDQVDVAIDVVANPMHVTLGETGTITFHLVNNGPGEVDDVRLDAQFPVRTTGLEVRPDARCGAGLGGRWTCRMGGLPVGGTVQASFAVVPSVPDVIQVTGTAVAANDVDPTNDTRTIAIDAGRLSMDPGHVSARTPWAAPGRPGKDLTIETSIANETLATMTYQIQAREPSGGPPAWLTVAPADGSIDPLAAQGTKVIFSPAALAPGLKRAFLHFVHDSPFTLGDVPVSFTVAFRDVPAERADDPYIHALAGAGVTAGCRNGAFCPDAKLSRGGATVWTLLSAEGGAYQPPPAQGAIIDVPADRPDAAFIEELLRRRVIDPCTSDPAMMFCPDAALARADAAVVVLRMLEGPDYVPPVVLEPRFRDMRRDPRAPWVEEAALRGFFTACAATSEQMFCPNDGLTRGDAAVSLVKAFKLPLY